MQKIFKNLEDDLAAYIQASIKEQLAVQKLEEKECEAQELLTISEVAALFSVSKVTIHSWMKKGILPYLKINSRTRFKKSTLFTALAAKVNDTPITKLPTQEDAVL